jgi:hypothetical protein
MAEIYNFFGDIFDYLREEYWEADFGYYENFTLDIPGVTLGQLVIFAMLACLIAALAVGYQRTYLGALIRALYARECFDEASAATLADLGLDQKRLLRFELSRPQTVLRKSIRYVGEGEPCYTDERGRTHYRTREVLDFKTTRFYLPEGLRERAAIRFSGKGSDVKSFLLTLLVAIVGGVLLIKLLPALFALADSILSAIGG